MAPSRRSPPALLHGNAAQAAAREAEAAHLAVLDRTASGRGPSLRKARGAHYTPAALVDHLVREALLGMRGLGGCRVVDPACGTGNFLVAAASSIASRSGRPVASVLEQQVFGIDIDPVAVGIARSALLALLKKERGVVRRRVESALARNLVVGDALADATWSRLEPREFGLVLGNPPFLTQLRRGTASTRTAARRVADATGGAVRRYADLSTAFMLAGLDRLAGRGRLAFVMPMSLLAASDAAAVRASALERAWMRSIWASEEQLFEGAGVRVCGLVLERGRPAARAELRRFFGGAFRSFASCPASSIHRHATWAPVLAEGFGAPRSALHAMDGRATIGEFAAATADFRDQYYGLRGAVRSGAGDHPLITTKHVDLARCGWSEESVRVHGARIERPMVDLGALRDDPAMLAWAAARAVPKILVATQTKLIEAWVDERGNALPLVPLVTVVPRRSADLWLVAAAVASPVVAARAVGQFAGSALGAGAVRVSARQLMAMPAPVDREAWRKSAASLRAASRAASAVSRLAALRRFAEESCAAHRLSGAACREILSFWLARLGA